MAKSRWMLAGLAVAAPGWAQAPTVTADDAMARYRTAFPTTAKLDCPDGAPGEIIVCGRRRDPGERDPNRLPLPIQPAPGDRVTGVTAPDTGGCISRCYQPVAVDLIGAAKTAGKIVDHLINGDE